MAAWKYDMDQLIMKHDVFSTQHNPEEEIHVKDRLDPADDIYTAPLRLSTFQKQRKIPGKTFPYSTAQLVTPNTIRTFTI